MPTENASPNAQADQTRADQTQPDQTRADKANIPPNGPDYGSAPPFNGMPFGAGFSGMPGYGMPPFPMPGYAMPGYAGHGFPGPGFAGQSFQGQGFPGQGFPGAFYPGMDQMMSQMMDRAAFMHRCMITMSNMAAEISRACQLLAQNPSQIGMPFPAYAPTAPGAAAVPGDKPVDMEALKQALAGMDPVLAQKTLYAVQMMQWFEYMRRGGQAANAAPSGDASSKGWS